MDLTHIEIEELLGAYALDAVEADERGLVAAHLRECPRCRAEVETHREVAGMLGNVGAAAPAGVWDRIAGSLEGELPEATPFTLDRARSRARPRRRRALMGAGLTAAAAVAVVLVVLAVGTIQDQQREIDDLALQMSDAAADQSATEALSDPQSRLVQLRSPDGEVSLRAVVGPDGEGYLLGDGLTELGSERTYQLWAMNPDETVSLGVLGNEPGVFQFHLDHPTTALAVTREKAGGVEQSENEPLASGTLA